MQRNFQKLEFFETYYYANIVNNIIADPFPYINGIHEWYVDNEEHVFLPAFPKFSRLHGLIFHVIDGLIDEGVSDIEIDSVAFEKTYEVWIDRALKHHDFKCEGFRNWLKEEKVELDDLNEDHLHEYHQELLLSGDLENLVNHLTQEVFHILFANRKLLYLFNQFMAGLLQLFFSDMPNCESSSLLKGPGVLKRVNVPAWAKRAVFYRDRGMCSLCQKDLSGMLSSQPDLQYDHVIPLAVGGLNDVTNIQLLCQECNSSKSDKIKPVSNIYESWY